MDELRESSVVLAVAGMEGALPSVVSGMVECPLIAVPTSVVGFCIELYILRYYIQ